MSTNETTALAERFVEAAWNRSDFATIDALAAPDFLWFYYPLMRAAIKGASDFKEFLTGIRSGMPDANFALERVATEGDRAVFRWDATGTHTGSYSEYRPQVERCGGPVSP